MAEIIPADASPEKRLFISLITRDISLADAILDLIDNAINAALVPFAQRLRNADDYQRISTDSKIRPSVSIDIAVGSTRIAVEDTAAGIPAETAEKHVFRFGRDEETPHESDRLSVYGIGLKRAMFKCGNRIEIISDHRSGGFEMDLDVRRWSREKKEPWTFEISRRPANATRHGTKIVVTQLHDDVVHRIKDGVFINQLGERIARTYSFFIGRIVNIKLNGSEIHKESFEIGDNYKSEKFTTNGVSCNVTAGIAAASGEVFRDRNAGWYVFCNGRAVLFADKTGLTGWGGGGLLPIFQPKHRPFLGTAFFVSSDPEALPWTTTKASVNEDSAVWQQAKAYMVKVGRVITTFLDGRYGDEGTSIAPSDLQTVSRRGMSVLTAAVSAEREFKPPTGRQPATIKIQYNAKRDDIRKIEKYLHRPNMGGSEVGRYTFNWFLKNEVGVNE